MVAAVSKVGNVSSVINGNQRAVDADLHQLSLNDLTGSFDSGAGLNGDGELFAIVVGSSQVSLCSFHIVLNNFNAVFFGDITAVVGAHIDVQNFGIACVHSSVDVFLVDGSLNSLTEVLVLAGSGPVAHVHGNTAGGVGAVPCNAFHAVQTGADIDGGVTDDVVIAGLQAQDLGIGIRNRLDDNVLDGGNASPVFFVGGQGGVVAADILNELVRTGTDGSSHVAFLTDFVVVGLAGDAAQTGSNTVGECSIGSGQGDVDSVLVHDLAGCEIDKQSSADGAGSTHVKGELDVFSSHFHTIVELDALAQMEGVNQTVLRDFVGFGQRGSQRAVSFQLEQAVVDVGQNQVVVAAAAGRGLCKETVGFAGSSQDHGILLVSIGGRGNLAALLGSAGCCSLGFLSGSGTAACAQAQDHDHCENECEKLFHSFLLEVLSDRNTDTSVLEQHLV